jgi:DNA-binding MarR family transcriptional regulator
METLLEDRIERMRFHIRDHAQLILGEAEVDTSGIELVSLLRMVQNFFETQGAERFNSTELSWPRWGILMRLLTEERRGNPSTTPTYLSKCQNVSKNTISSLLRGLEDQGLIQRTLDPVDKRIFHIQLTGAGRTLIETSTPKHITHMNHLVSELSPEEKDQLTHLLAKLYHSLLAHSQAAIIHGG